MAYLYNACKQQKIVRERGPCFSLSDSVTGSMSRSSVGQPRRCDFPGEVQGTWEWTKGFFVKCFVQAQSPWGADVMAPRLIWKEGAEGGRRKGTGNAPCHYRNK
jgi:hypothetical protein